MDRTRLLPKSLLAAALVLLLVHATPGQRYQVRVYQEADGLPRSEIADIAQDSQGVMWFATRGQLVSYDGLEWQAHGGETSAPAGNQHRVLIDSLDRIWILPKLILERPAIREAGTWRSLNAVPGASANRNQGWKASTICNVNGKPCLLGIVSSLGAFLHDGKRWSRLTLPGGLHPDHVTSLTAYEDRLFVGTRNGLYSVDQDLQNATRIETLSGRHVIGCSVAPKTGDLCVLGQHWLGTLRSDRFEFLFDDRELASNPEYMLGPVVDWHENVYFGDGRNVLRYEPGSGVETLNRKQGLAHDGASVLRVDREGNVWVGAFNRISKIVSLRFANYDTEHGLLETEVTSILRQKSGRIVLGHPGGLSFLGDSLQTLELDLPQGARSKILDLAEDRSGNVWIAAHGKGLGQLDPQGNLTWRDVDPSQPDGTNSVLVDEQGRVWVSESQTIWRADSDEHRFEQVELGPKLSKRPFFRKLFLDLRGRTLIACYGGLAILDGKRTELLKSNGNRHADNVYAVLDEPEGTLLGTADGLMRIEGRRIVPIDAPGPSLKRPVYLLLRDEQDRLWCGTDDGVFRWDGASWTHFTVEDGLIGREVNRAGGLVDPTGDVWIGTESGVSIYRERHEHLRRPAPILRLLGIDVDGISALPNQPLTIAPETANVNFRFRGTSLVDENRIEFRYRLLGFDPGWQGPERVPGHAVRYTLLPPGRYKFEIQARDHAKSWSRVVRTDWISVPVPIWQRWWFLALLAMAGLFAGYVAIQWFLRGRYTRGLEQEVAKRVEENKLLEQENEKTRKLESLGVLAGGIAHDFNNLLTVMTGSFSILKEGKLDKDEKAICSDALAACERARALTQQLLTFSRGGAPLLRTSSISEVVEESVSFVMRGADVRYECNLPEDLWMVRMDADQISQVLGNLLLNARQISPAGSRILISGQNCQGTPDDERGLSVAYVEIAVQDEGPGIERELLSKIFDPYFSTREGGSGLGLATAYSIVKRHNSKLLVESTVGRGTCFRLLLPAADSLPKHTEPPRTPPTQRKYHVLIMDDDQAVQSILCRMLDRLGHTAVVAANGSEALTIYEKAMGSEHAFNLVLMDLTIPGGLGGKDAISHLLKLDPSAKAVVLSGYSNDEVLSHWQDYGFHAAISKPIAMTALIEVLRVVDEEELGEPAAGRST